MIKKIMYICVVSFVLLALSRGTALCAHASAGTGEDELKLVVFQDQKINKG